MKKFGYSTSLNDVKVLHLTEMNAYSPNMDALILAKKLAVKKVEIEFQEDKGKGDYQKIDMSGITTVLVTTRIGVDQKKQGDFLQDCVEKGINVVLTMYSNASNYNAQPLGRFSTPLVPGKHDYGEKQWKALVPDSLVLEGDNKIEQKSDNFRSVTTLSEEGECDLIAEYKDGNPMIAIRKDQPGLVTSIGFACGSHEGEG